MFYHLGGQLLDFFGGIFSGTFWHPKRERQNGQNAAECGQDAARMRKDLDPARSSPPVQISYRNLCRMSCRKGLEMPLAAGLAAGAGGFGSLEALAMQPWAQEF